MEEREHAIVGASSAARWLKCAASSRLEDLIQDEDTKYSEEGTQAHALAELILNEKNTKPEFPNDEMEENVMKYVNHVVLKYAELKANDKLAKREHEVKLDFSNYVPEGFGTGDTIILALGELHIFDLKYGKGIKVSAVDNPQLKLYGLGALNLYDFIYDVKKVVLHIVQPRLDNYSDFEISPEDLTKWGDEVKKAAEIAFSGEGEAVPGEHCQFCKVAGICRARSKYALELKKNNKEFKLLRPEELADIYDQCQVLTKYASELDKYILNKLMTGEKIEGFKLVEGRSLSQYADQTAVENKLHEMGYDDAIIHKPRELLGLTEMKKLIKTAGYKELEGNALIIKPQGKPTIAKANDPRPEYGTKDNVKDDFEEIK